MPTPATHAFLSVAMGKLAFSKKLPLWFYGLLVLCAVLPDLDTIAFSFGIPYEHPLGHRGLFHSLTIALVIAIAASLIAFYGLKGRFMWRRLMLLFFVISASHGLLDTLTNGGLGIALFAPFNNTRHFFPFFRPIEASPIGIRAFWTDGGWRVMISEFLWIWLPTTLIFVIVRACRTFKDSRKKETQKAAG